MRKAFGSRAERLLSFDDSTESFQAVKTAFRRSLGVVKADELGFHSWDWREDAAFMVALHLFPEEFTPSEIRNGIDALATHAPYHINGMAELLDYSTAPPSTYAETPQGS